MNLKSLSTFSFFAVSMSLTLLAGCGSSREPVVDAVAQAATATGDYVYSYDPAGLAASVGDRTGSYAITRTGDTLTAGTDRYHFDALGRVDAIDDGSIVYGPDGQIDHAVHGAQTVSYLYDENGQRIMKLSNGTPTAAYAEEAYVTATELDEPVRVAGHAVGILRNGQFVLTASDARGTVQADSDGTQRLASPFGARAVHSDVSAITDYGETRFDADLGADRMGVRDYDAKLARFLQPDPLFLENPERCVTSPVECSLYGYARSRPLDFRDASGTESTGGDGKPTAKARSTEVKPLHGAAREQYIQAANAWAMKEAPGCYGQSCLSVGVFQQNGNLYLLSAGFYGVAGVEVGEGRKGEFAVISGWDPEIGWHVSVLYGGGLAAEDHHLKEGVGGNILIEQTLYSSSGKHPTHVLVVAEAQGGAGGAGVWRTVDGSEGGVYGFANGLGGSFLGGGVSAALTGASSGASPGSLTYRPLPPLQRGGTWIQRRAAH